MDRETATSKLELIMGAEALGRLQGARVMVVGLGGVGSSCAEALARGGIGSLVVVDKDVVQRSNINRQAIAFESTLGRRKTDVVRGMVADINPDAEVMCFDRFVLPEDVEGLMAEAGRVDYIVDAIDTISTKLALAERAGKLGIPVISSMGAANKLRPECLEIADIAKTSMCPMCRVVRREARKRGIAGLRVIYSREEPVRPDAPQGADARDGHARLGTVSYMPPIMGQMMAGFVIRELAGLA